MTKILDKAFEEAQTLPEPAQESLSQWVQDYVKQHNDAVQLTPEQRKEVYRRVHTEPDAVVGDEEVEIVFDSLTKLS